MSMGQLGGTMVEAYRLGWKAIPLARELLLSNCCAFVSSGLVPRARKRLMDRCDDGPW